MDKANRIKQLRKDLLGMTQQEFADSINISRSNLANIETGKVVLTERVASDICLKHNINEVWLLEGTGNPIKELSRQQEIAKLSADLFKAEKESFKSRLIMALAELDDDEWRMLESIAQKITKKKDQE